MAALSSPSSSENGASRPPMIDCSATATATLEFAEFVSPSATSGAGDDVSCLRGVFTTRKRFFNCFPHRHGESMANTLKLNNNIELESRARRRKASGEKWKNNKRKTHSTQWNNKSKMEAKPASSARERVFSRLCLHTAECRGTRAHVMRATISTINLIFIK